MIRHGSMFAGIEGFGLGLELAGWPVETVWQSEIDPFCLEVLAYRYPHVQQLGDITTVDEIPAVELLTAGFPCQPVSQAGRGLAQDDPRWLWPHVDRVIRKVRPRLVILENVRGLRSRGLALVLGDLARAGYDAQWDLLPAAAFGAPHLRHRFWIVAYPHDQPIGRIFGRRPPVFPWAAEEPAKPRLLRQVHRRRDRLRALGNGVVPHAVAGVALSIETAGTTWGDDAWMIAKSNARKLDSFGNTPPVAGALIGGDVFPLPTSAPKIKDRLWPTAAASDWKGVSAPGQRRGQLEEAVKTEERLWPTPSAADGNGKGARIKAGKQDDGSWRQINLVDAVVEHERELWPTPNAADGDGGRHTAGNREGGPPLAAAVNAVETVGGSLNPRWVEWLMGYPSGWTVVEFMPMALEESAA